MAQVIWEFAHGSLDIAGICQIYRIPPLELWQAGQPDGAGGLHATSGCRVLISAAATSATIATALGEFMQADQHLIAMLHDNAVSQQINVWLEPRETIVLCPSLLQRLGALGLPLCIQPPAAAL